MTGVDLHTNNVPPGSSSWYLLESGNCPAAWNMALDEVLLESVAALHRPVLRFYGWTEPAATFGYSQHWTQVASWTSLRPLIRRPTGGGLVPHVADWTYSLVFPPDDPWYQLRAPESYKRIHEWIMGAFSRLGVPTELADTEHKPTLGQCFVGREQFDLLHGSVKLAGAAQRRTRAGLLIQGSVQPREMPCTRGDWQRGICSFASSLLGVTWVPLPADPARDSRVQNLALRKYSQPAHNECR